MSLIRYQAPDLAPWMAADRWSNLRDELHSLLESPFWSGLGPGGNCLLVSHPRSIFTRAKTTLSRSLSCPECARKTSKSLCTMGH